MIEIILQNKYSILLINIYGPNRDCPVFYENIFNVIDKFTGDFVILGGDFNLIQDATLDYSNYTNINNPNARNKLLSLVSEYDLIDPWRVHHNNTKKYTWHGPAHKQARLDFF